MRANELERLRAGGVEPCLLMDTGVETGRLPFGEAALALRPGVNMFPNWYFADPENQRGLMEYGAGYSIDRWILQSMTNGKLVLHSGYATVVATHNDGICVYIKESDCFLGETYTMSVLTFDNQLFTYTFTLSKIGAIYNYPDTEWSAYAGYKNGMYLFYPMIAYNKADQISIDVVAVKLEHSLHQTLAHQDTDGVWVLNDPPPNKALELLKCQRYFLRLPGEGSAYTLIGHGKATSNSQLDLQLPIPAAMRGRPSVRMTGSWVAIGAGMYEAFEAENMIVELSHAGTSEICIIIRGFKNLIPNHVYTIQRNNDGSGNIDLSCEL